MGNMKTALILFTYLVAIAIADPLKFLKGFEDRIVRLAEKCPPTATETVLSSVESCIGNGGSVPRIAKCIEGKTGELLERACLCSFICKIPHNTARELCKSLWSQDICTVYTRHY